MLAKGCAGTVPQKDKQKMDGLTIAYTAQTAVIQKARTPCFGMMHTKLRGEGGRVAERNLFLAVQLLHKPLKPDIVLVRGKHTLPRCNFSCYYDEAGIRAGDPACLFTPCVTLTHCPLPEQSYISTMPAQ